MDLVTGKGLAEALQGVETVIDVVGLNSMHTKRSTDFFMATTENLHREGKAAGVKHHVVLSIVGVDKAPTGLYAGKRAQEEEVRGGDIPWTILRSTQFHEFVTQILAHASAGPLVLVPRFKTQPVAAAEVAEALVHAAEVGPLGTTTSSSLTLPRQVTVFPRKVSAVRATSCTSTGFCD